MRGRAQGKPQHLQPTASRCHRCRSRGVVLLFPDSLRSPHPSTQVEQKPAQTRIYSELHGRSLRVGNWTTPWTSDFTGYRCCFALIVCCTFKATLLLVRTHVHEVPLQKLLECVIECNVHLHNPYATRTLPLALTEPGVNDRAHAMQARRTHLGRVFE
jgi:hypothetical protein